MDLWSQKALFIRNGENMELVFLFRIIVVLVVLGVIFIIKERIDQNSYRLRMKNLIEQEWGCYTRDEYTDKIMQNIRYYARQNSSDKDIDDITWNDLDMDTIFLNINHTRTSAGEEYLYRILRTPKYSDAELEERERTIQSFLKHPEKRNEFEISLCDIGKTDRISVYEYLSKTKELKTIKRWPHILAAIALLAAIGLLFVSPAGAIVLLFVFMVSNAYFYYKEKAKIAQNIALFAFILGTLKQCKFIAKIEIPGCEEYFQKLGKLSEKFSTFCRFQFLVSSGNSMSGSLFDAIFDYVRILFHVDLIKLGTMIREVQKYEKDLLKIYDIIGYLDSMLAVASYRSQVSEYAVPKLYMTEKGKDIRNITACGLYHPLLRHPVKNDICTSKCMLLTGSNASGKSTFIKAVAINAIFAQTIHTVLADEYSAPFFRVYSSMALRDDILSNESYFIVEIKSLKRIFSKIESDKVPVLCFIDEILRGTNTVERVAASTQLLQELAQKNAMCFAATHDIELTYLLEEEFENYHFEEVLDGDDISFDYTLKKGRANSRNAIRLLEVIGFGKDLVSKAQDRVEYFLSEGKWK